MDSYDILGTVGEGTYGLVLKARHKDTGQVVAVKKFKESDEDEQVRKTALREVRILKQLKHDNIVNLIEVFRKKGKLYLVFEYVERTILEDLEKYPDGLDPSDVKKVMWQLLRAIEFCHAHDVVHRDIKPENLLISKHGALKLCDFGFARTMGGPGAKYTDYVATRWYRAPELLVGDPQYGKAVDVWAIGCMFAEITNGLPLYPGESDIDQLFHIIKCFGRLTPRQEELFQKNPLFVGIRIPECAEVESLDSRFGNLPADALDFMKCCLACDPAQRGTCTELLRHPYFNGFSDWFEDELRTQLDKDAQEFLMKRKKLKKSQQRQERMEERGRIREERQREAELRDNHMMPSVRSRGNNDSYSDGLNSTMSSVRDDYGDTSMDQSHLPDLRTTTPKAQRLVAFPQLASEHGDVDDDAHAIRRSNHAGHGHGSKSQKKQQREKERREASRERDHRGDDGGMHGLGVVGSNHHFPSISSSKNGSRGNDENLSSFPTLFDGNNKKKTMGGHVHGHGQSSGGHGGQHLEQGGVASYKALVKAHNNKYGKMYGQSTPKTPNIEGFDSPYLSPPPRTPQYDTLSLPPPSPNVDYGRSQQHTPTAYNNAGRNIGSKQSRSKGSHVSTHSTYGGQYGKHSKSRRR